MLGKVMLDWRVDPDGREDRTCSPVTVRKMTEEEWQKYGSPVPRKKGKGLMNVMYLTRTKPSKRAKVTDEQLMAEIKEHGTDKEACIKIAEKYGYSSWHAVKRRIEKLEGKK